MKGLRNPGICNGKEATPVVGILSKFLKHFILRFLSKMGPHGGEHF